MSSQVSALTPVMANANALPQEINRSSKFSQNWPVFFSNLNSKSWFTTDKQNRQLIFIVLRNLNHILAQGVEKLTRRMLKQVTTFSTSSCPLKSGRDRNTTGKWNKPEFVQSVKLLATSHHILSSTDTALFLHHLNLPHEEEAFIPIVPTMMRERVTCGDIDKNTGLICVANDDHILLLHWDSILGQWEVILISEGDEGRTCSVSLATQGRNVFISAFNMDSMLVYSATSTHPLREEGPLQLDKIECVLSVDKAKEWIQASHCWTSHDDSGSLFVVASSPTLTVKMWLIEDAKSKLLKQQTVPLPGNDRVVSSDVGRFDGSSYILFSSAEGTIVVFQAEEKQQGLRLVCRVRLEDGSSIGEDQSSLTEEVTLLNTKFYFDRNSAGAEQNNSLKVPRLLVLAATKQLLTLINVKSGHCLHQIRLFGADVCLQEVALGMPSDDGNGKVLVAAQVALSNVVNVFLFTLPEEEKELLPSKCTLLSEKCLDPKSVLRKRFKSPIKVKIHQKSKSKPAAFKPFATRRKPIKTWTRPTTAKVKLPPSPSLDRLVNSFNNSSDTPTDNTNNSVCDFSSPSTNDRKRLRKWGRLPLPQRTQKTVDLNPSNTDGNLDPSSFCHFFKNEELYMKANSFTSVEHLNDTGLSDGQSYLRLAVAPNSGTIAIGGSISPVVITGTRNFGETKIFLMDVQRVTSLHVNFDSSLLLLGSNDGTTKLVDPMTGKDLMSFTFASKFNEHIHTQFYFMDKFILQPQCQSLHLYAVKKREEDSTFQVVQAGSFPLQAQKITAVGAANQFLSSQVVVGLSNKSIQVFNLNAEKVELTLPNSHSKPVSCLRLIETPRGSSSLSNILLSSAPSYLDHIKLWDVRSGSCVLRVSDINPALFCPSSRPDISPCGRFLATGCEEQSILVYDTRKLNSRLATSSGHHGSVLLGSTVLDTIFDSSYPIIWNACRNGKVIKIVGV